jgi:hypothetical protein
MAVLVKNLSLVDPQTIYTGVDINKVGVNVNKFNLNRLLISTGFNTSIDVYAKAWNRATNSHVIFYIVQGVKLYRGSIVNVIPEPISLTSSYSIYLARTTIDKEISASTAVSCYFDYTEQNDPQFVSSYETLNY